MLRLFLIILFFISVIVLCVATVWFTYSLYRGNPSKKIRYIFGGSLILVAIPIVLLISIFVPIKQNSNVYVYRWDYNKYKKVVSNNKIIEESFIKPSSRSIIKADDALKSQKVIINKLPDSLNKRVALKAIKKLNKDINKSSNSNYTDYDGQDLDSWSTDVLSSTHSTLSDINAIDTAVITYVVKNNKLSFVSRFKLQETLNEDKTHQKMEIAENDAEYADEDDESSSYSALIDSYLENY